MQALGSSWPLGAILLASESTTISLAPDARLGPYCRHRGYMRAKMPESPRFQLVQAKPIAAASQLARFSEECPARRHTPRRTAPHRTRAVPDDHRTSCSCWHGGRVPLRLRLLRQYVCLSRILKEVAPHARGAKPPGPRNLHGLSRCGISARLHEDGRWPSPTAADRFAVMAGRSCSRRHPGLTTSWRPSFLSSG